MSEPKKILLTRDPRPASLIHSFAKSKQLFVIEQSFIQVETVKGLIIPKTGWIFITSPLGGSSFIEAYKEQCASDVKWAALGEKTARALPSIAFSFIGNSDLQPAEIAENFQNILRDETVLFPQSHISQRSVSKVLPENQVIEMTTYCTLLSPTRVDAADILVFTSPSNLDGYLSANEIPSSAVLICYGDTTYNALTKMGLPNRIENLRSSKTEKLISKLEQLT